MTSPACTAAVASRGTLVSSLVVAGEPPGRAGPPRAVADVTRLANLAARTHQPQFTALADRHRTALQAPSTSAATRRVRLPANP